MAREPTSARLDRCYDAHVRNNIITSHTAKPRSDIDVRRKCNACLIPASPQFHIIRSFHIHSLIDVRPVARHKRRSANLPTAKCTLRCAPGVGSRLLTERCKYLKANVQWRKSPHRHRHSECVPTLRWSLSSPSSLRATLPRPARCPATKLFPVTHCPRPSLAPTPPKPSSVPATLRTRPISINSSRLATTSSNA